MFDVPPACFPVFVPLARHQLSCHSAPPAGEDGEVRENKVRSMATQLLAKFEENSSTAQMRSKVRDGQPQESQFKLSLSFMRAFWSASVPVI